MHGLRPKRVHQFGPFGRGLLPISRRGSRTILLAGSTVRFDGSEICGTGDDGLVEDPANDLQDFEGFPQLHQSKKPCEAQDPEHGEVGGATALGRSAPPLWMCFFGGGTFEG